LGLHAQTDTLKNPEQYLFREFSRGEVAMKTGSDLALILNYNVVAEKMLFIQKGKLFELLNPGSVDTIYLYDRRFIPVGKVFYEVLAENNNLLFVQHRGDVQQPLKTDPYGTSSQASSTTPISNMKVGSIFYTFDDPNIKIKKETIYWVPGNNSMLSFKDGAHFIKIFPDYKNEIKLHIKQNNLKFVNPDEVLKLLVYCNSLMK
jgi:hypothetical protein